MSRIRAPLILCSLLVPVCFVLFSQRQCSVSIGALKGGDMRGAVAAGREHEPPPQPFRLAYEQSFGFFDDIPDDEWKARQELARTHRHYRDDEVHKPDHKRPNRWYMLNYPPIFICPHQYRVGGPGDGPKWVCDPHRLKNPRRNGPGAGNGQRAAPTGCSNRSGCKGR
jgi:Methyltransferase domain